MSTSSETPQLTDALVESLLARARKATKRAYAPYSKFPVGAALLTSDGDVFTGANIENSSFSATICAERVAIFKAVSEGHTSFRAIAIAATESNDVAPCGACRQVIWEFAPSLDVIIESADGYNTHSIRDLLPLGFSFSGESRS